MPRPRVLVLNPGSSSLKASLIELPDATLARTEISWGVDASRGVDRERGLNEALASLEVEAGPAADIAAVGYRVVHGGARFRAATWLDDDVVAGIRAVAELAPLHNGVAVETIEAGRKLLPELAHVACFDTAFHANLAPEAFRYPVPERWYAQWGVRRYGFHGLSVAWSVRRSSELLGRAASDLSLVVAHLGSGCSVTAVHRGRSVDTSMGLTPLEGLMMGTRSGSIDPGLPAYLVAQGHLGFEAVTGELEHASGLLGVGGSGDMRELLASAGHGDGRASLAISMFVRSAAAWIAALSTSLPRLDALVFTGGIGENAAPVRAAIVSRLGRLGLSPLPGPTPDPVADGPLNASGDGVAVLRVAAREDLVIASQCIEALPRPA